MSDAADRVRALFARVVRVPEEWTAAERRRGQAVLGLSFGMILAAVPSAIAVATLFPHPWVNLLFVASGVPVYLAVRWSVRHRHVDMGARLIVLYFVALPVVGALVIGQLQGSPMLLALPVVLAGVLLPPRGVAVAAVLSLGGLLALPHLLLDQPAYTVDDVTEHMTVTLVLVTAAALLGAVVAQLGFGAADTARRRSQRLADELSAANTLLEERVQGRTRELSEALARERHLTERLSELSVRDPLTELYNRRYLDRSLEQAVALAVRTGDPLSLAVIDLDHFKAVNETYSHVVGDDVLCEAASVLTAVTRAADILIRMGGDEFVLLMPSTTRQAAWAVCERMRANLASHDWGRVRDGIAMTATFGVVTSEGDVTTPKSLLLAADLVMFEAKRQGKNRVVEAPAG